jgi:thioredoxin reductase (NADPH)
MILAVDDDAAARSVLEVALRRRFGTDYDVIVEAEPGIGFRTVERAMSERRDVALVLANHWMRAEHGTDFLARVRDLEPTARRMLMTDWADFSALHQVARASTLGDIDHYAPRPWNEADEQFLAAVGTVIAGWAREHGRYVHAVTILGERWDADVQRLLDTLERWGAPVGLLDIGTPDGRRRASEPDIPSKLPVVILPDGRVLPPDLWQLAHAYGGNEVPLTDPFDLIVLGAGPAGLSAAVYAASEGLSVLLVEPGSLGGQASSSPMIRNYLGFPDGVSGAELLSRAWEQAWRFGVRSLVGREARAIRTDGQERVVEFDDGSAARARAVVIASGLAYRRLGIPSVDALVGRGIFYGSGATEAQAMTGEPTVVVGGANSAAEAAVHLARYARSVTVLVRGDSLVGGMSDYLIEQLQALTNVDIRLHTEIVEARDDRRLRTLLLRNGRQDDVEELDATAAFVLIGAAPGTDWLPSSVARDPRGFVLTGSDAPPSGERDGQRAPFETTLPGVHAVGDVRHGSIKRVATAVGEGANAIRSIVASMQ